MAGRKKGIHKKQGHLLRVNIEGVRRIVAKVSLTFTLTKFRIIPYSKLA